MNSQDKGFTLIELIVTIAILAILVTAVVVALNPAEQLARSRDSKRTTDMDSLRSAFNLYLAQATTTVLADRTLTACKDAGSNRTLFLSTSISTSTPSGFDKVATSTNQQIASTTQPEANGSWAPARIDQTPGGAPISSLPADPVGTASGVSFYAYACNQTNKTYEFTARLESSYFKTDLDIDGLDGGNSTTTYEVGTDLTLIPNGY